jgi:hypothetical protein
VRPLPRLNDDEYDRLTAEILDRVAVHVPEWTNWRDGDPGVTLVELVGFLGESLLQRRQPSRRAVTRLREVAGRLQAERPAPCSEAAVLVRNRYFDGRLLSVVDLEQEQRYQRDKHRRHNLLLHGVGIVRGLEVTVEQASGGVAVVVTPGVAIGPDGEELLVCERLTEALPSGGSPLYVTLRLDDRPTALIPRMGRQEDGEEGAGEASRIEEVVELELLAAPGPGQLAVGRVEQEEGGAWRVDETFPPARVAR